MKPALALLVCLSISCVFGRTSSRHFMTHIDGWNRLLLPLGDYPWVTSGHVPVAETSPDNFALQRPGTIDILPQLALSPEAWVCS